MGKSWLFELNAKVTLQSGEKGSVIGRAEYAESADHYLVRYTAGDGRLVENWWSERAFNTDEQA